MKQNRKIISKICKNELYITQKRRCRFFDKEELLLRSSSTRTMVSSPVPLQAPERPVEA